MKFSYCRFGVFWWIEGNNKNTFAIPKSKNSFAVAKGNINICTGQRMYARVIYQYKNIRGNTGYMNQDVVRYFLYY